MVDNNALELWLKQYIADNGGVAGTVHVRQGEDLQLGATINIPPPVVQKVQTVPNGKGMAGLALMRDAPVQTCNLKDDTTGDVRPGAKAVNANAAAAIPIHDSAGSVRGVVGIAFMQEREIGVDEMDRLKTQAEKAPI
jgi:L-methionine (R)-S-oxide reductase